MMTGIGRCGWEIDSDECWECIYGGFCPDLQCYQMVQKKSFKENASKKKKNDLDDFIKREAEALIQLVTYERFDQIEPFLRSLIKEAINRFA